jgi:hypothetical protein
MSVQSIAAASSEDQPQPGQKNRSGVNFQFLSVPSSGVITSYFTGASGAPGISATLVHDKGGATDEIVAALTQAGTFDASKVATGDNNYYIASPNDAGSNFVVYFQGNV